VELDVASLVVMLQGLGGVLLGIGEDNHKFQEKLLFEN
jgi:hypothetical protein